MIILGTPLYAIPRPWLKLKFHGVMVNAYEIISMGRWRELRGRGLRKTLGIDDDMELWIDSGGYQFLRRGIEISVDKLARLYKEIDADYYVSLDYPPGPRDAPELRSLKIAKTVSSFISLRSKLRPLAEQGRLVPVFHLSTGETLRLQLAEYEPNADTAAIGGLIPHIMQKSGKGSRRKAILFMMIVRKLWRGRLHAMGLASAAMIPLLRYIGIESGDTQTWRHKAAYGKIIVPGIGERHVSRKRVRFGPAVFKSEKEIEILRTYLEEARTRLGVDFTDLVESFEARALFNSMVILDVASNNHGYLGISHAFKKLYESIELLRARPVEELEAKLDELLALQPVEETPMVRGTVSLPAEPSAATGVAAGVTAE